MKIKPSRIEDFIKRPDPAVNIVLFYGKDPGLVFERSKAMLARWLPDPNDDFAVTTVRAEDLSATPSLLAEEVLSLSLMGGDRVVVARGIGDAMTKSVQQVVDIDNPPSRTILEAGDLAANSKLRKLIEASPQSMAIPCYRDEQRDVLKIAREVLGTHRVRVDDDVWPYLTESLGSDRAVSRSELEKLALYAHGAASPLGLDDVEQVIGDSSALDAERLSAAVFHRDTAEIERITRLLLGEGVSSIFVLRAIYRFASQLLDLRLLVDQGQSAEAVVQSHKPPIHFKSKPVILKALPRWRSDDIVMALKRITELEVVCKSSPLNEALMLSRGLTEMARLSATR